jgi:hypothetical protein
MAGLDQLHTFPEASGREPQAGVVALRLGADTHPGQAPSRPEPPRCHGRVPRHGFHLRCDLPPGHEGPCE